MREIEILNENCSGAYQNTKDKVSWKMVGDHVHF